MRPISVIKTIEISNFGKISSMKLECNKFNIFQGDNDQGKTTILDAIEWAIVGNNDESNIKNGESKCEVIIDCDTGVRIERRLQRGGTNKLFVYHHEKPLNEPQKTLNKIFNPLLFDPTALLTMKAKELNTFISDAISKRLKLSDEQIKYYGLEELDLSSDPVNTIKDYYDKVYSNRTTLNREVKTTTAKMDGIIMDVSQDDIDNLAKIVSEHETKLNEARANNAKIEISKNNLNVKLSTEKNIEKLKNELESIKDINIEEVQKEYNDKCKNLKDLQDLNDKDRLSLQAINKVLQKLDGEISCPLHSSIKCATNMMSFKKELEEQSVNTTINGKKRFSDIVQLQQEVNNLKQKIELYTNVSPKKLELERAESLLKQLEIFSGDPVETSELEKELKTHSDKLSKLKVSLEMKKIVNIDDLKQEQEKADAKVKLLKELLETVIPNMLKINIKDITLSKDGIYYQGVPFNKLGDSYKLRLSIGILKDLFPTANIYNLDRLERLSPQALQKYVNTYANQNNDIQYFGAYVGIANLEKNPKVNVVTIEKFAIKV